MENSLAWNVYYSLAGPLQKEYRLEEVENLFEEGSACSNTYSDILDAYERLCDRLGTVDEDDVEIIISSLRYMEMQMSMKMFEYGLKYNGK